jgi:hypothetical protein
MWYLQGFSLNAYMEFKNSMQVMFSDVASDSEKSEALRHATGYLAQVGVFLGLSRALYGVTKVAGLAVAETIAGALSEPPESEEEKERKRTQEGIKFFVDWGAEATLSGMPAPAQGVVKEGVNQMYKSYAKGVARDIKEETNQKPDERSIFSDPSWDIFYTKKESGALGTVISAGKTMLKAAEEETNKNLSEEHNKAVDKLQYIKGLGFILGNGDLIRIAGEAERQIKSQK